LEGGIGSWVDDFAQESVTITGKPNVYTEEFVSLLKDYYLKL